MRPSDAGSLLVSLDSMLYSQPRRTESGTSYSCTPCAQSPRAEAGGAWTEIPIREVEQLDGAHPLLHSTSNMLPILGELDLNRFEYDGDTAAEPSPKASPQFVGRRVSAARRSAQVLPGDVKALLQHQVELAAMEPPLLAQSSQSSAASTRLAHENADLRRQLEAYQAVQESMLAQHAQVKAAYERLAVLQQRFNTLQGSVTESAAASEGQQRALELKDAAIAGLEARNAELLQRVSLLQGAAQQEQDASQAFEAAAGRLRADMAAEAQQSSDRLAAAEARASALQQQLADARSQAALHEQEQLQDMATIRRLQEGLQAAQMRGAAAEAETRSTGMAAQQEAAVLRERLALATRENAALKLELSLAARPPAIAHGGFDASPSSWVPPPLIMPARPAAPLAALPQPDFPSIPLASQAKPASQRSRTAEEAAERSGDAGGQPGADDPLEEGNSWQQARAAGIATPRGQQLNLMAGGAGPADGEARLTPRPTARPYATEVSLQEFMGKTARLEARLMDVNSEKALLDGELARAGGGGGRTLAQRNRRAAAEARLAALRREAGTLRMALKEVGALKK